MKVLEFARRFIFWILDFVTGGNIRKYLNDVIFIQKSPNAPEVRKQREKHLNLLLEHALGTVPFYQGMVGNGEIGLEHFPVVNKVLVLENYERFRSTSYLDRTNHKVSTSGSTGNPFTIFHNKGKRNRNIVDTIYFSRKVGFYIGNRLYYLRLWDKQYKKTGWQSWAQNIDMQSVDELDDERIQNWIERFENDRSNKSILAYTSALRSICQYLDRVGAKPLKGKPWSVIAMSEGLDDFVVQGVKKYFGVVPVSRYSNSENGIIAQQVLGKPYFEINWASYYVEILDLNKDIPVKMGQSGRIVVTDLFNYCMPLIRYDTGDIGSFDLDENNNLVFRKIEGRKMDMFTNTKGEYISSHIIHHVLQFEGIDQFQFIQEVGHRYIIKLKVNRKFDFNNEPILIAKYRQYFGEEADIVVDYVKDIPLLSSGKRKLVINNAINKYNLIGRATDSPMREDIYNSRGCSI